MGPKRRLMFESISFISMMSPILLARKIRSLTLHNYSFKYGNYTLIMWESEHYASKTLKCGCHFENKTSSHPIPFNNEDLSCFLHTFVENTMLKNYLMRSCNNKKES